MSRNTVGAWSRRPYPARVFCAYRGWVATPCTIVMGAQGVNNGLTSTPCQGAVFSLSVYNSSYTGRVCVVPVHSVSYNTLGTRNIYSPSSCVIQHFGGYDTFRLVGCRYRIVHRVHNNIRITKIPMPLGRVERKTSPWQRLFRHATIEVRLFFLGLLT